MQRNKPGRLTAQVHSLRKDHGGSAVVTVLIAIVFLSILGAILLFTTYTGFRIKVYQSEGENRNYDAETAMSEVRAGLQGIVSDTIAKAYTGVLENYTGDRDIDLEFIDAFKTQFLLINDIFKNPSGIGLVLSDVNDLFSSSGYNGNARFDATELAKFISNPAAELSLLSEDSNGNGYVEILGTWVTDLSVPGGGEFRVDSITIQGLRVTYESDGDYLSIVESDITVNIPNLSYARSMLSLRDVSNYAFIAKGLLSSPGSSVIIDGSAYVGGVSLNVAGGTLSLENGTLISGGKNVDLNGDGFPDEGINGDISVAGQGFTIASGASVWANNIRVGGAGSSGTVNLLGTTYTAGSLILDGFSGSEPLSGSSVTLGGRFIGFGDGQRLSADDDRTIAEASSSIIVNSKNSYIDLSGLSQLYIAGQTFISAAGTDVMTGQSMAVKSDQLAYLIPASHISNFTTNPILFNDDDPVPVPEILYNTSLWGTSHRLSNYIPTDGSGIITAQMPVMGSPGQWLMFVFINFTDMTDGGTVIPKEQIAGEYFIDYFTYNPSEIRSYLDVYMSYFRQATGALTSGNVFYTGDLDTDPSAPINTIGVVQHSIPSSSSSYQYEYENRRRTLSRDAIAHPADNPFDYMISRKSSSPLAVDGYLMGAENIPPPGIYRYEGEVVAYVYDNNSTLSLSWLQGLLGSGYDTLRLIISYADVNADREFKGLILCDRNINISAHVYRGEQTEIRDALRGKINVDDEFPIGYYLNVEMRDDSSEPGISSWNFAELVRFDNWKKR